MSEEHNKMDKLLSAWEEYKSTNDARLAEIEKRGSADPLTNQKLDRIDTTITELDTEVKAIAKKVNRPGTSENTDEAAELHRKAFDTFLRKGAGEDELPGLEAKAMTIAGDSGNDGGHTVPAVIDSALRSQLVNLSPMRQLATVQSISSGNFSVLLNERGTGTGWVDEDDARTATSTPKIKKLTVPVGEIYANLGVTQQLLDDSMFDLEGWLATEGATQFAAAEGAAFIAGDGSKKPSGILASGTGIELINSGSDSTVLRDSLISMVYALKSGHRQGASFLMNSLTESVIRKLKVDTAGDYLWAPGYAGAPATLLGYGVFNDENMPDIAADAEPIAFGNFKAGYLIVDRMGIRVLRDPYTNKPYVQFYSTARVGGRVVDDEAIKLLTISDGA